MTDNITRTIAALREQYSRWPADNHSWTSAIHLRVADLLALCDAAEAGLRCPPREPHPCYKTGLLCHCETIADCHYAKPINEGGQERSTGDNPERNVPVPPSPDVGIANDFASLECVLQDANEAALDRLARNEEELGLGLLDGVPPSPDALARAAYLLAAQAAQITRLTAELADARAECEEQARLLGMSGSREAKLLTEIDSLKHDNARMIARESELVSESERLRGLLTDAMRDCSPEEGQAWSLLIDEPLHDLIRAAINAGRKP